MLTNPAYHAIIVSLASGLLVLAFLAITLRAFVLPGDRSLLARLSGNAETVALWAASLGLGFFLLSMILGFQLRPLEAFMNSPISKNKILASFIAMSFWGSFLLIKGLCRECVWTEPVLKSAYWLAALGGVLFLLVVNSVGGSIAGIPSGFEQIVAALGIPTRQTYYLPSWGVWLLLIGSVTVLAVGIAGGLKHRRQAARVRSHAM
jgi:hypothetical protein